MFNAKVSAIFNMLDTLSSVSTQEKILSVTPGLSLGRVMYMGEEILIPPRAKALYIYT